MPYYPRRRTYRKKRTYKRKSMSKRRTMKRRKTYRKRSSDKGTYLKISSSALPVVLNNKSAPQDAQYELTPDTLQAKFRFRVGDTESGASILIDNEQEKATSTRDPEWKTNDVYLGSSDLFSKYKGLYKYMQVYKIVVKFTPTITEGGVISPSQGSYYSNAINGMMTTDIDSNNFTISDYTVLYPATVDGNAKANGRSVSRETRLTRGWTRTFIPKDYIQSVVPNPKARYQYKPEYSINPKDDSFNNSQTLGSQKFIIRMRKPQLAGFTASSIEGTEVEYPAAGSFVRFGTMMVHAYVKFKSPIY